ncbi:orotidine-5'-phosphate decarboxylase [Aliikangiella maris]|uniref:Orotidine 5'-phosphate decarboxylase n=2 Tax=Aliikangiella maris TaxID=3162458 RepID=A0ABV3MJ86_9GAMM
MTIQDKYDSKIIVALDFDDIRKARSFISKIDPNLCKLKVGKEMFTLFGPDWVRYLVEQDFSVFLDLKFFDIPNTVAKACKAAAQLGVWMVDVHASGGEVMMRAAQEAIDSVSGPRPLLTAVTVLTSFDEQQYQSIGYHRTMEQQVKHLGKLAELSGLDGIVCSAQEANAMRVELGPEFKLVTPGIRPAGSATEDQSRVMTPEMAIQSGVDYLVIGRPITQSSEPLKVLCEISESIKSL